MQPARLQRAGAVANVAGASHIRRSRIGSEEAVGGRWKGSASSSGTQLLWLETDKRVGAADGGQGQETVAGGRQQRQADAGEGQALLPPANRRPTTQGLRECGGCCDRVCEAGCGGASAGTAARRAPLRAS